MMPLFRTAFIVLLISCAANTSRSVESARDQYKSHEDVPEPLSEATDKAADVLQFFKPESDDNKSIEKTEETPNKLNSLLTKIRTKLKEAAEDSRPKRDIAFAGYNYRSNYDGTWNPVVSAIIPIPPLSSFEVYQPQYIQISRPYFIPVWGASGKIPIYFPPQPLYINPGYPVDNPPNKGSLPPSGYLPPDTSTPSPVNGTTMPTINRFEDDLVWGRVPNSVTTTTIAPTRRTRKPGQTRPTHPPLVHNNNGESNDRPAKDLRPPTTPLPQVGGKQPSRCVWAIISCCSTSSQEISYSCFEQLGCTGAFWDKNPCDSEFAKAAIKNVINYYEP